MKNTIVRLALTLCALLSLASFTPLSYAQQSQTTVGSNSSYIGGMFIQSNYANWTVQVSTGNTATGAGNTIVLKAGYVVLPDGRAFVPFSTTVPITIFDGSPEVVTPSAVSGCNNTKSTATDTPFLTCTITANFTQIHGAGALVTSGDAGFQEAVLDAGYNGGGAVYWSFDSGPMTLNTGGANTTYTQPTLGGPPTNFFPANSIVLGVIGRVTTAITGTCSGWSIDDGTTAVRFTANNTGLTVGTTAVNTGAFWNTAIAAAATGPQINGAKPLRIVCATGAATLGAVKVRAYGWTPVVSAY